MKTRNGFVSNSSSSSFIVAFPFLPKSIKAIKEMLFKYDKHFYYLYDCEHLQKWSINKVCKAIREQLKGQKPNDTDNIIKAFQGGWHDDIVDFDDYKLPDGKCDWETIGVVSEKIAHNRADNFLMAHPKKYIYTFEFADDTDFGAALEHGDTFENVRSIRISRH